MRLGHLFDMDGFVEREPKNLSAHISVIYNIGKRTLGGTSFEKSSCELSNRPTNAIAKFAVFTPNPP